MPQPPRVGDAHDVAHHEPHRARHAVAVQQQVLERLVAPAVGVHGQPLEELLRVAGGDAPVAHDLLEGREDRVAGIRVRVHAGEPLALGEEGLALAPIGARSIASSLRRHHA